MHWLKTDGRDLQTAIVATKRQGWVLVRFKRFPELRGVLKGIVLDVMVKGDPPGTYVFAKDCLALYDDEQNVFYCGFCEPDERVLAPDRAALYRTHLYEPFRKFVNELEPISAEQRFPRLREEEFGHGSAWKSWRRRDL